MILHYGYRPTFTILGNEMKVGAKGGFGVLFFFVVSGFFLAQSAKKFDKTDNIPECCRIFAKKKYVHYMTWYLPAFILCALLDATKNGAANAIKNVIYSIPNLMLLGTFGFSSDAGESIGYYIGASWFISALFWCQLILFPIIISNYKRYMYVFAPIMFLFSLASWRSGFLSDAFFPAMAFTAIILGTLAYGTKEKMCEVKLKKGTWFFFRIIAIIVYLISVLYMCQDQHDNLQYSLMFLLAFAIVVSTNDRSAIKAFNRPVFTFLGKVSFPLYLLHIQIFCWGEHLLSKHDIKLRDSTKYLMLYIMAIGISIFAYYIKEKISRIKLNKLFLEE